MKHVFGPVPSRRLGRSLGIDPIPFKTCNWNCVYCQLGRTSHPTNRRRDDVPPEEILAEVREAVSAHAPGEIDWVTFVGSGEPTLHANLGAMIRQVKTITQLPVAVITNGSLLYLPEVRRELAEANAVLPTLDAGSDHLYRRINRPMSELDFDRFVEGLVAFRQDYSGSLWVEVMLVDGLNDTEEALREIAAVLARVRPDQVHINLPVRPPCEPWVRVPRPESLDRAQSILGAIAKVVVPTSQEIAYERAEELDEAIAGMILRHPMREEELDQALGHSPGIAEALGRLAEQGRAQRIDRHGQVFWSGAEAKYVDESLSRCHAAPHGDPGDST
jgi:wyosine [tRNA(Phe)-imidazoG37] synthetase (radical SAM superfamily)